MSDIQKTVPFGADEEPLDIEQIYRRHGYWLAAYLRRRFGSQDAEDLEQETYVRALAAQAAIRNPRAFLARVAVNAARDQVRRQAVRPVLVADVARTEASPTGADQAEAVLLKQVIKAMPPKVREAFLLSRSAGLTYDEIAQRCGVSVKRVEARMTQALALCTALMK